MKTKWIKIFIGSSGGILLAAAFIRLVIAAGNNQVLLLPEPLLCIPLWSAVLIVGGIELTIAIICLLGKQAGFQAALLAWLGTIYGLFWITIFWKHYQLQGTCLGSLTDPFHLAHGITGVITGIMPPCYLLLGSYPTAIWLWLNRPKIISRNLPIIQPIAVKFCCTNPACRQHLMVDESRFGRQIQCPACGTILQIPALHVSVSSPSTMKLIKE